MVQRGYRNGVEWGIDSLGNRAIWWFTIWLALDIGYIGYIYIYNGKNWIYIYHRVNSVCLPSKTIEYILKFIGSG